MFDKNNVAIAAGLQQHLKTQQHLQVLKIYIKEGPYAFRDVNIILLNPNSLIFVNTRILGFYEIL